MQDQEEEEDLEEDNKEEEEVEEGLMTFSIMIERKVKIKNHRGELRGRGKQRGRAQGRWSNNRSQNNCYICGKFGHYAHQCYYRNNNKLQSSNFASTSNEDGNVFVMNHMIRSDKSNSNDWYVDSRCSNHMSYNKDWFSNLIVPNTSGHVQTGDDTSHSIKHIGDVKFQTTNGTDCLSEVLHVPTITKNLISVGQIVEKGYQVRFTSKGCYVEDPRKQFKIIAKGTKQDRLFTMEVKMHDSQVMFASHDNKSIAQLDLWHKRLGHVNVQKLKQMQYGDVVHGLPNFKGGYLHQLCEACQFGKQSRLPFKREKYVSRYPLEIVHSDVWGPTKESSIGGNRYFVTFIDDYSRKVWVMYFIFLRSSRIKFKMNVIGI